MNLQATLWTTFAALKILHNATFADCNKATWLLPGNSSLSFKEQHCKKLQTKHIFGFSGLLCDLSYDFHLQLHAQPDANCSYNKLSFFQLVQTSKSFNKLSFHQECTIGQTRIVWTLNIRQPATAALSDNVQDKASYTYEGILWLLWHQWSSQHTENTLCVY